ncbi:hypothetical protein EJ03DRAFT_351769 [Teratosphaeria nubilosa]|uniref:Apple domain-containing protein n=1 Tax=Teratosphaeria nubilosa TaxID=161662 RepID=A0A6G1L8N6_9PEZI|nr:hypothetical protein EJ03DRAFT_351769 [Teratosphaeria nubilosa]
MRITTFLLPATLATATPFSLFTRQTTSTDPNPDSVSLVAATPKNYTAAFRNATGSTSQSGYHGYYLLQSYNTTQCAAYCNSVSGCQAFNISYERDPLQKPASACPDPAPTTNFKCALWSQAVRLGTATNVGQYQDQFHVVIAGSDGFNVV